MKKRNFLLGSIKQSANAQIMKMIDSGGKSIPKALSGLIVQLRQDFGKLSQAHMHMFDSHSDDESDSETSGTPSALPFPTFANSDSDSDRDSALDIFKDSEHIQDMFDKALSYPGWREDDKATDRFSHLDMPLFKRIRVRKATSNKSAFVQTQCVSAPQPLDGPTRPSRTLRRSNIETIVDVNEERDISPTPLKRRCLGPTRKKIQKFR